MLRNQIDIETRNYAYYKDMYVNFKKHIEYEKKGFERFLKSHGKCNLLEFIQDYEKMEPLPID